MQRKRGPLGPSIICRAGIAALALLLAASLAFTVVACWPRPIPAATVSTGGTTGHAAAIACQATQTSGSVSAAASLAALKPRRDPRSPELPNKFEQAKFQVPAHPRPLAPIVTNAPAVGSAEVAQNAPVRSRRTVVGRASDGNPSPAPVGQEAPGSSPHGTAARSLSMCPPE